MWHLLLLNNPLLAVFDLAECFDSALSDIRLIVFIGHCRPTHWRRPRIAIVQFDTSLVVLVAIVAICIAHLL